MGQITISLFGPFRVTSPEGGDLTPGGAKSQGLLALLATARGQRRGRVWLQDKLWSDRGQAQAAGSLRQALVEIRRAFGDWGDVLEADRTAVALDADRVTIPPANEGPPSEREFLQGIDVRDPEFEAWLREMRAHFAATRPLEAEAAAPSVPKSYRGGPQRLSIAFVVAGDGQADQQLLEAIFIDTASRSLREVFDIDLLSGLPVASSDTIPPPGALLIPVRAYGMEAGRFGLRVSIEEAGSLRAFWSDCVEIKGSPVPTGENVPCLGLAHRLVRAVSEVMSGRQLMASRSGEHEAAVLAASAFRKMFTMRHDELETADTLLSRATEIAPRGLFYAWRAQLAAIRHVERQSESSGELRSLSEAQAAHALETEPLNSNVLAAVANARLVFENDLDASSALACQAVAANRANPLAWWAWANATLYGGNADAAYAAAITAQNLADRSTLRFWADFQRSLTAAVTGRTDEAIAYGAAASALAPSFRPPLRYLIALYARKGAMAEAERTSRRLLALEQDFSAERLLSDPAYPVSLMRRAGLVDRGSLSALIV